jgi:hypothetical protein
MTRKTTATVPATKLTSFQTAIAEDIKLAVKTMTSGRDVAAAFDERFAFDWTRYKGNASAEKCGMSAEEFKLVRDARTEYRDAWNNATDENGNSVTLYSFDRRWQYVTENSAYAPVKAVPSGDDDDDDAAGESGSSKTKKEQCIAALQNALRYATHEDFDGDIKTAVAIRVILKMHGVVEAAE